VLVTPVDIGTLVSSDTWVPNGRESVFIGLKSPPTCVGGNEVQIIPDVTDIRGMSGAFTPAPTGPTSQWFDSMNLPTSVRSRMFYLVAKAGTAHGLTVPSRRRQSFDRIIASNTFGATIADKLEIAAPFEGSTYVTIILFRIASAEITLPRLQFAFAVAAQALTLLVFLLVVTVRNRLLNTYRLVQQLFRLPTLCIELMYVLYYQIFDIMYLQQRADRYPR
jgi:hypothetical protein